MSLQHGHLYEFGKFRLDPVSRRLLLNGQIVALTPKALDLLVVLVENQGRTVGKEELLKAVWPDTFVEEGNLTQNVSALRKTLAAGAVDEEYILTVPREGYRFIAPVREPDSVNVELASVDRTETQLILGEETGRSRRFGGTFWSLVSLALLAVAALAAWTTNLGGIRARRAGPKIRSIAVLPFQNLSRDPEQDYFSDGTTEALISNLAQIHSLRVISRTAVMRYKGTGRSSSEIGQELGVDGVIEGSVQHAGGRVRVTTQLIFCATNTVVWSREYNRELSDLLNLEGEIATEVAEGVRAQLTPQERGRLAESHSIHPAAQEAYLLGRYHLQYLNPADLRLAAEHFEEAVRIEPRFAAGYAGLADARLERGIWGGVSFIEVRGPSREAVRKALELDPNLAEAHSILAASLDLHDWDWAGAEQEFKRAFELDPNDIEGHFYYANMLMALGRRAQAIEECQKAAALDPVSSSTQSTLGRILFRARRYNEAIPHLQRAIELDPRNFGAYTRLAEVYEQMGKLQAAQDLIERGLKLPGAQQKSTSLARLYALLGRREDALRVLRAVTKNGSDPTRGLEVSLGYFALGDKERGFEWLTKAFDARHLVIFMKEDPRFDSVRSDPRFQQLVARLKMP